MKPLSRRSVIAGSAAVVTAIPAVGLAQVAKGCGGELQALIKAHRAASRAFDRALDLEAKHDEAFEESSVLIRCPMAGEAYEIRCGKEMCGEYLLRAYDRQPRQLEPLAKIAPDIAAQAAAAIDAAQKESIAELDRLIAEDDARKEACGFAEAERHYTVAEQAERDAVMVLCEYRCQTIEEARTKAKYLRTLPLIKNFANEEMMALLGSFAT